MKDGPFQLVVGCLQQSKKYGSRDPYYFEMVEGSSSGAIHDRGFLDIKDCLLKAAASPTTYK